MIRLFRKRAHAAQRISLENLEPRLLLSALIDKADKKPSPFGDEGPPTLRVRISKHGAKHKDFVDTAPIILSPTVVNSFGGSGANGWIPPDTMGAVSPSHIVDFINDQVVIRNKSTGAAILTETGDTFWANAGVSGLQAFDSRITFDTVSQRWFASSDVDSGLSNSRLVVGVSTSSDPTQPWKAFAFASNAATNWADFPTLGVDANGVYMAADLITQSGFNNGSVLYAWSKSAFLNFAAGGATPTLTTFSGPSTAMLATYDFNPAKAATAPQIIADRNGSNLELRRLTWSGGTPSLSAITSITIPGVNGTPVDGTQPGSSQKLDAGFGWLNNATITNNGTYLWTNIPTTLAGHAASIWAQINLTDNTVVQSGQVADPTADILYPSIAANDNGDAVIGYTKVSSSLFASIFANARLGTDAPGTLQGETLLHSGSAVYSDSTNTSNIARWGDYSNTVVDPSDPNKFWTYQEYAPSSTMYQFGTFWSELSVVPNSISGTVFVDANTNGILDAGESRLAGATVYLDANNNGVLDPGGNQSDDSGTINQAIPDNNATGISPALSVSGLSGVISHVTVTLNITHARDSDLSAYLIGPNNTQIALFSGIGGSGDNFTNTTFDDAAGTSISSGSAPFSGTFSPTGSLAAFNGMLANGTWKLKVTDTVRRTSGTLVSWSINITTTPETSTVSGTDGSFTFSSLVAGAYVVREQTPAGYTLLDPTSYALNVSGSSTGNNFALFPTSLSSSGPNDIFHLWLDPNSGKLQIGKTAAQTGPVYQVSLAALPLLSFNLTAAGTQFILDYSAGSPLGSSNISLNGNDFADTQLLVIGTSFASPFTMTDTQIGATGGGAVLYQNLASLSLMDANISFTGTLSTLQNLYLNGSTYFTWN